MSAARPSPSSWAWSPAQIVDRGSRAQPPRRPSGACPRSIPPPTPSPPSRTPPSNRPRRSFTRSSAPISRASICRARRMPAAPARRPTARSWAALNGLAPSTQNYALGFTVTFPVIDLRRAARARGRAIGQHPRRGRARPPDRGRPAGPVERRGRRSSKARAAYRRQHPGARSPAARAAVAASRPPATSPDSATSTKWPKRSACSPRPKSTTRWPGWASGAGCWQVAAAAGDIQPFLAEAGQ